MTGTYSCIVDEHIYLELFSELCAPNNVYDVCQQSYHSRIVASRSFNLRDSTDVVSCLLFRYLLVCHTSSLYPSFKSSWHKSSGIRHTGTPPCVPCHIHSLSDSRPPTRTLAQPSKTPITAPSMPRTHVPPSLVNAYVTWVGCSHGAGRASGVRGR